MAWWWVDTEYNIHRVPHSPKIVYLAFIRMIMSWPPNVASTSSVPPHMIDCHQQALHENSKVQSPGHIPTGASWLTDAKRLSTLGAVHRLPLSTRPNSPHYGLQVLTIMSSKSIYTLALSQSRSASLRSVYHGLQMYLQTRSITASNCISRLAR